MFNDMLAKYVVLHEDDVGMTHGANVAFAETVAAGGCSAGSVMVPCPWFTEAARRFGSDQCFDLGVHLTLNSEAQGYRWRPLTGSTANNGLCDSDGYFWAEVSDVRKNADPNAVLAEFRAQIEQALASGIDVTHLDAHMGTALCPEFVECYGRVAEDFRLPILLLSDYMTYSPVDYSGPIESTSAYDAVREAALVRGNPIFQRVIETPWDRIRPAEEVYEEIFAGIKPGLTFLSLHFNAPGDFEVIVPNEAHIRTEEYALFRSEEISKWIERYGLTPIGFREVRDAMRSLAPLV
jgi:hypothetical protein